MDAIIHAMGTLFLVATPIGNLEDITIRAIKTLLSAEVIACEDTRKTGFLLSEIKKRYLSLFKSDYNNSHTLIYEKNSPKLISFYDSIETNRTPELIELLNNGHNVALVSDAGTPLINDPGYLLVKESRKRNIPVISIPGPAAFLAALTSSGLPANQFMFLGYPPKKTSHRKKLFNSIKDLLAGSQADPLRNNSTMIFYCAPHKLEATLKDIMEIFGDIEVTLARELTKLHEQIWTGRIFDALTTFPHPKGEFVILFIPQVIKSR